MISPAFLRYVDLAREGRVGSWRLGAGVIVILVVWGGFTVAAFFVGAFLSVIRTGIGVADPGAFVAAFLATPGGVATALVSFLGMSLGVFLAVRLVHRRRFGSVLGASGRLSWGDFRRGLAAGLLISALSEVPSLFSDPLLQRNDISLGFWLLSLAPFLLLLSVQVSAEELAFRGYLTQELAARFRSPLVWAVLPIALFTALHFDGRSSPEMTAAILLSIAAFAVLSTTLVVKTGNLGAGVGVHLGLNAFAILVVSHTRWLSGAALFVGSPMDEAGLTLVDAAFVGLLGVGSFALMALLLLHPRSPLKVGEA